MSQADIWSSRFAEQAGQLPGAQAPWLAAMRKNALDRFISLGWPTTKNENWRHTSLTPLSRASFQLAKAGSSIVNLETLQAANPGYWMVFVDGQYSSALSTPCQLPQGVRLEPLADTLNRDPEALRAYFDENAGESPAALNLALAADGAFLQVADGVQLDVPVNLVFVAASPEAASFPRTIVVLGNNARASVVEHYVGQGGASFTNTVFNGHLGRGAYLDHIKVQQEGLEAWHLGACNVRQEEGSNYQSHSMSFGARLARHDITTVFDGRHCEALLNGLYYINGRRHVDHHTRIEHAQPDCISNEFYRGILEDAAHGVFTGRIRVHEGADRTDAVQRSDSLLLSRLARADARPELEIYADDVKCAHGATVGQLDEDSLFYLRSRGLDKDHAHAILTYAFAAAAVDRITHTPVREQITNAIRALMPAGQLLGEPA